MALKTRIKIEELANGQKVIRAATYLRYPA